MIQNELKKISDERTVFIIAHRISSIIHADQILVLDNGRLVERGTHEQLLAKRAIIQLYFIINMVSLTALRRFAQKREGVRHNGTK